MAAASKRSSSSIVRLALSLSVVALTAAVTSSASAQPEVGCVDLINQIVAEAKTHDIWVFGTMVQNNIQPPTETWGTGRIIYVSGKVRWNAAEGRLDAGLNHYSNMHRYWRQDVSREQSFDAARVVSHNMSIYPNGRFYTSVNNGLSPHSSFWAQVRGICKNRMIYGFDEREPNDFWVLSFLVRQPEV